MENVEKMGLSYKWQNCLITDCFDYKEGFCETITYYEIKKGRNYYGFGEILPDLFWMNVLTGVNKSFWKNSFEKCEQEYEVLLAFVSGEKKEKQTFEREVLWKKIKESDSVLGCQAFYERDFEDKSNHYSALFYETVKILAHIIYGDAITFINNSVKKPYQNMRLFKKITRIIGMPEDLDFKNNYFDIAQAYFECGLQQIDAILDESKSAKDESIIKNICELIEKYSDSKTNNIVKEYFKKKRCIACYLFEQAVNGKNGYIAFSGLWDASSIEILTKLNIEEKPEFCQIIQSIASQNNMELVVTNESILRYDFYECKVVPVALAIDIAKNVVGIHKSDYACCERKIFTKFNNNFIDGTLYVKMPPCARCIVGILEQYHKGRNFPVYSELYFY